MTKLLTALMLTLCLCLPVSAAEFTAPEVPDSGQALMPETTNSFGQGLMELLKKACARIHPNLAEAARVSVEILAATVLVSLLRCISGLSKSVVTLAGAVIVSVLLFSSANTMIRLGCDTIQELSSYGKLLFPVMTAALAAQGGVTSSTALYAGTAMFDTLLGSLIARVLTPMLYLFLALGVAVYALGDETLKKMQELGMGHLSIGVSNTLCKYVLLPYLSRFTQKNPHIQISIYCQSSYQTMQALESGTVDIGLIGENDRMEKFAFLPVREIRPSPMSPQKRLSRLQQGQPGIL